MASALEITRIGTQTTGVTVDGSAVPIPEGAVVEVSTGHDASRNTHGATLRIWFPIDQLNVYTTPEP